MLQVTSCNKLDMVEAAGVELDTNSETLRIREFLRQFE